MLASKFFALIFLFGIQAFAGTASPPTVDEFIPEKQLIEVMKYDKETDSYLIRMANFPKAAQVWVAKEIFISAVPSVQDKPLKKRPEIVIGNMYSADKAIRILYDFEREARRKKQKAG